MNYIPQGNEIIDEKKFPFTGVDQLTIEEGMTQLEGQHFDPLMK